jgi:hypothetical protein
VLSSIFGLTWRKVTGKMTAQTSFVLAAVLLLMPLCDLAAQERQINLEGARVRVSAPAAGVEQLICRAAAPRPDALVLDCGTRFVVPLGSVRKLEISQGYKSRTLEGGLVGLAAGLVLAVTLTDDFASGAVAAGAGTLFGLTIGSTIRGERWQTVRLDLVRLGVAHDAVHLSFSASHLF